MLLVGFMGAGKTSVGQALGQRLNWLFEDLDDRVERRTGRSVAEIFRQFGETEFRRAENEALRELIEELRGGLSRVIALGGGAFAQPRNVTLLQAGGVPTVFLDAPVAELWRRCREQAKSNGLERPLLRSFESFQELYRSRRRSYEQASLLVRTGGRTVDAIIEEIVEVLRLKKVVTRMEQGEAE
ncbi:MAG TPA: shikimate kinase [Verrucomicrobiae bacterium]|nr:shikimate kinase [Verrucomicrobiae bacterium]